ncbi:nicotinate-nucleotide adenylyltransferase [Flavisphingomonas formosensis]|uniref:nicotinate-nucleotide adenylyltransferase n=1 Tax=Flavisphingomonas formosensis TaxID=861534 RepID=UPI0012F92B03|nr:nicotinate-nucleotide adenylyltransferase [Sphingomonas formosensis]
MIRTGLLGGSFNPAHRTHRKISLAAMEALGLDEVWWLVSPGNPLKRAARDMAPLAARYGSALRMARRAPIRPTVIELDLRTRYTVDTLVRIVRRYPHRQFIWLMGSDNLEQFPQWRQWRRIARTVPIAVVVREGYDRPARAVRAMGWLRRFVRPAGQAQEWTHWRLPALVQLRFRPDPVSATRLRATNPGWHADYADMASRDRVTRRPIPMEDLCPVPPLP